MAALIEVSDRVKVVKSPYKGIPNGATGEVRRTFHKGVVVWVYLDDEDTKFPWSFMKNELEVIK